MDARLVAQAREYLRNPYMKEELVRAFLKNTGKQSSADINAIIAEAKMPPTPAPETQTPAPESVGVVTTPQPEPMEETAVIESKESAVVQPDANGEFPSPVDGALWMASLGIPQTPLQKGTKKPFLDAWQDKATTNSEQIRKWATEYPGCNFGSVGKAGKHFVFEVDSPEVKNRFESTGQTFSSQLVIQSRPNRGHRWYVYAPGVANISQTYTKHGDFSVRADDQQCVSPGSIHPETGKQYLVTTRGVPAVPTQQEIDFWNSERVEKKSAKEQDVPRNERGLIPYGQHLYHGWLLQQAGKLRQMGLDVATIETALLKLAEANLEPPIDFEKVKQVARSMQNYEPGQNADLALTQPTAAQSEVNQSGLPWEESIIDSMDTSGLVKRPIFPAWVLEGTSIGEGLVKPAIETSSKHAQFIFFPAVQIMMNYLSGKVEIPFVQNRFNMFVLLVSPYGKFFKSSSVGLAQKYFKYVGILASYNRDIRASEGKVLLSEPGSAEGFCLAMDRVKCKNAILFNDELSSFVAKATIESSSLGSMLLKFYESAEYSNLVKKSKDGFSFEAGTYTFGWIACTTDRAFPGLWPKVAGHGTGISDRVLFVCAPEKPKEPKMFRDPLLIDSVKTRKLIDDAIKQGKFEYEDAAGLSERTIGINPRSMEMMHKLALYFAIDLGLQIIDEDCVERAKAVVEFADEAALFLEPVEAESKDGRLQKEILRELRKNKGMMSYRELCRELDFMRYGMYFWTLAYAGLLKAGIIKEFQRKSTRRPVRMVGIVKQED